jgi:hypothetical protein
MAGKEGCFRPSNDEKSPFKERILEASKFIVGSSCQLSIFIDSIWYWGTELAVVPELRGVLKLPERHARYATDSDRSCYHSDCLQVLHDVQFYGW